MAITVLDATPAAIAAAGTTFAFQPGIAAAPGDVLLVIIAQDNGGTNGAQSMTAPTLINQTAGKGTVTQRRAQNYDPGAVDAGITQGIFEVAITAPFETTDWIQANSSASDQIAVHVVRLRPDPGFVLSFGATGGTTGSSTNAPTTTTGSITSGDVVVAAYAGETNESITGDADTSNGSWSTQQQATANTGTVGTSVRVAAQWKVVTGTAAQTYNPTNTTAANSVVGYVTYTQAAAARAVTGWRWYADAAGLGAALAAENTTPTLTPAQNKNVALRLRAMLRASANLTEALSLQYKTDNSGTWVTLPASGSTLKDWPRYANGADTAGGTVTRVLTGADTNGVYIEATASSQTVNAADNDKEFDFSISFRYVPPATRLYLRINGAGGAWQANGLDCIAVDSPAEADWEDNTGTKSIVTKSLTDAAGADAKNFESYRPKGIYDGTRWWLFYMNSPNTLTTIRYRYWDGTSSPWSAEATQTCTAASKQSDVTAGFYNDAGTLRVFVAFSSSTTVVKIHRGVITGTTITWDSEQSLTVAAADSTVKMGLTVGTDGYVWIHGQSATELYAYRSTNPLVVTSFGSKITNAQARTLGGYSDSTFALPTGANEVVIFRITGTTSTGLLYSSIFTTTATAEVAVAPSGNVHNTDWGVCLNSFGDIYCIYSNATATSDTGTLTLRVSQDKGATWTTCTSPSVTMDGTSTDGMFVTDDGARGCYIWYTKAEASSGGNNTQIAYKHYTVTGSAVTTGTWDAVSVLFGTGMGNGDAFWTANLGGNKILTFHERGDDDATTTLEFYINYGSLALAAAAASTLFRRPPALTYR